MVEAGASFAHSAAMRIRAFTLVASLVALGSCARAPSPAPAPAPVPPAPRPAPAPAPAPAPLSSDWRDWPITPGTWRYAREGRGAVASFGAIGAEPALTIRCDRGANAVYLTRRGDPRGTGFTIRTTSTTRALPTQAAPEAGHIAAVLGPDDRLLDAIGFSRGRFVVEAPPLATLVVPAWAEILRVVEDCRS